MANMSYCRFRNTLSDLRDCKEALEALLAGDYVDGPISDPLSRDELAAATALVENCFDIARLVAEHAQIDLDDEGAFDQAERHADTTIETANAEFQKEHKS